MKRTILILTLALSGCALPPQVDHSADVLDSKKRDMWTASDGEPYQAACSRNPALRKYYNVKRYYVPAYSVK